MQLIKMKFLMMLLCSTLVVSSAHAWSFSGSRLGKAWGYLSELADDVQGGDISLSDAYDKLTTKVEEEVKDAGKKVADSAKKSWNQVSETAQKGVDKAKEAKQSFDESEFGQFYNDKREYLNSMTGLLSKYTWEKNAVYFYNETLKKFPNAGSVAFHPACDMDEDENVAKQLGVTYKKASGGVTCIDDPFNWIDVNAREAWNLAQDYAKLKITGNPDVICSPLLRQSGNDDFIMCSAVDNSAKYYEFKFNDVRETQDSSVHTHLNKAICEQLFGGTKSNNAEQFECLGLKTAAKCEEMKKITQTYVSGMDVTWKKVYNNGKQVDACIMGEFAINSPEQLRTIDMINGEKFKNFQFNNQTNLEDLIERYVRGRLKESVKTFECDKSTWQYNDDDDGITCHVNGQPVDFVFDDIRELDFFNVHSREANMGMECLGPGGGVYDGNNCHGLQDQAACDKFERLYPESGGTDWDDDLKLCTPADSQRAETSPNWVDGLTAAGFIVVGIAATVATGGAATPFLVVMGAVGAVGTAVSTVGTVLTVVSDLKYPDESRLILGKALNVCSVPEEMPRDCPTNDQGQKTADYDQIVQTLQEVEVAFFNSTGHDANLDTALMEVINNCVQRLGGCWSEYEKREVLDRVAEAKDDATGCGGNMRGWANCLNTVGAVLGLTSLAGTGLYKTGMWATKLDDVMAPVAQALDTAKTATKTIGGKTASALKAVKGTKATATVGSAVAGAVKAEAATAKAAAGVKTAVTETKLVQSSKKALELADNFGTGKDSIEATEAEVGQWTVMADSVEVDSQYEGPTWQERPLTQEEAEELQGLIETE